MLPRRRVEERLLTQELVCTCHEWSAEWGSCISMQECLIMFKGPADIAVEEVHTILRQIVFRTLESEDCKNLQQYTHLKREIAQTAAATLGMLPTSSALHCKAKQHADLKLRIGRQYQLIRMFIHAPAFQYAKDLLDAFQHIR